MHGNCLLKTLEEPPEYVVIILIAQNEANLLNTIKSRCMKIKFKAIEKKKISQKLEDILGIKPNDNIIDKCDGSIGKALNMQNNEEVYSSLEVLLNKLETDDLISVLNNSNILYDEKEKIKEILEYINVYLFKSKQINKINCIKYVEETRKRIDANCNYDMCIDYLLMNLHREINNKTYLV